MPKAATWDWKSTLVHLTEDLWAEGGARRVRKNDASYDFNQQWFEKRASL